VRAVKAFKRLSLDRTSINCQVGWNFLARFFVAKSKTFVTLRTILSVEVPVSDPPKCSFNVSLGSTGLN